MIDLRTTRFSRDLVASPWNHRFLQVCRWVEARSGHLPRIGEELHPQNECLRLGQSPSTTFAPREIASARLDRGRIRLLLFGLGLYGPSGPLPLHLTEEIHERQIQNRDSTLADFLDIFHHRWLSLFYRAWAQGQSTAGLDRREDERFSVYVSALLGHRPASDRTLKSGEIPAHASLAAAGHLVRHARNAAGFATTLEHYFGVPFQVEEYVFQWLHLEEDDRVRLGQRNGPCHLGRNTVLGRAVPDRQFMVILHASPSELSAYERFLPGGDWFSQLAHWIRCFVGLELRCELRLTLPEKKIPDCRLGRYGRLGRTAWLPSHGAETQVKGRVCTINETRGSHEH